MPKGKIVFRRCHKTGFLYMDIDSDHPKASVALVQCIRRNYKG